MIAMESEEELLAATEVELGPQIHDKMQDNTTHVHRDQQTRFEDVTAEDAVKFVEQQQNKNTMRKTVQDTRLFCQFLQGQDEVRALKCLRNALKFAIQI